MVLVFGAGEGRKKVSHRARAVGALIIASILASAAHAQIVLTPGETQLLPDAAGAGSGFGWSVDIDGELAVVGAPDDDMEGAIAGRAYVYRLTASGWVFETTLVGDDTVAGDRFGRSVAVDDGWVAVGAPFHDECPPSAIQDCGAVYIFRKENLVWDQFQKVTSPLADVTNQAFFGGAVDLASDPAQDSPSPEDIFTLAVGARDESVNGVSNDKKGVAFLFQLSSDGSTWNWIEIFSSGSPLPPDTVGSRDFGNAVAISGDWGIIGDLAYAVPAVGTGKVYGLQRMNIILNWNIDTGTQASDAVGQAKFGNSVDIYWDPATNIVSRLVGAREDTEDGGDAGAAYLYQQGAETKLHPEMPAANNSFGRSVAIHRNSIAIGGHTADTFGAVWAFSRPEVFTPFAQVRKIVASDRQALDQFGWDVAVFGDWVVVGAPFRDGPVVQNDGAVYIYEVCEFLFCDGFESGDTTEWSSSSP